MQRDVLNDGASVRCDEGEGFARQILRSRVWGFEFGMKDQGSRIWGLGFRFWVSDLVLFEFSIQRPWFIV